MTRTIPLETINAANKPTLRPFFAVDLSFDSPNELRMWSGYGDLTIGGTTYTGAGQLLQVSDIRESSDVAANGATLTLSGIPSNLINLALDEDYQGRLCRIKFGLIDLELLDAVLSIDGTDLLLINDDGDFLDVSASQPASFFDLFVGYMDQMNISEGPDTSTISLSVENKMIDLERARSRRYTDAGQQSRFTGDLAFEFVTRLQGESIEWGA